MCVQFYTPGQSLRTNITGLLFTLVTLHQFTNHSYCFAETLSIHGFLLQASPRFFIGVSFSNYPLMTGSVSELYHILR